MKRVMEVVKNYDVDGVHFDDYFYYEKFEGELDDEPTFIKYNRGEFTNKGNWRRNNVYKLVDELSKKINNEKPWVRFGISPAGVWGNKSDGHVEGSNTQSSFTNYDKSFADTKKWVEDEIIDYIAPQIYFEFANPRAPYAHVASWWANVVKDKNVHLYVGQALYKVNYDLNPNFIGENGVREIIKQTKFNSHLPEILGSIMFRTEHFIEDNKKPVVEGLKKEVWNTKVLIPSMTWKDGDKPSAPINGEVQNEPQNVKINWECRDDNVTYYAIYRYNENEYFKSTGLENHNSLIATVRKTKDGIQEYIDKDVENAESNIYVVTALDRLHNESKGLQINISRSSFFKDVNNIYSWASKPIDVLYQNNIVVGDNYGNFNPSLHIKRADFMIMIVKSFGLGTEFKLNFTDVNKGSYYYNEVGIAKNLGIVKGDGYNFRPEENITREDMTVVIENVLTVLGIKLTNKTEINLMNFNDSDKISNYARQSISMLINTGTLSGYNGYINPKGIATRAEVATLIYNVLNKIE